MAAVGGFYYYNLCDGLLAGIKSLFSPADSAPSSAAAVDSNHGNLRKNIIQGDTLGEIQHNPMVANTAAYVPPIFPAKDEGL